MRTLFLPAISLCLAVLPAAAHAQISGYGGSQPRPRPSGTIRIETSGLPGVGWQLDRIGDRIDAARKRGALTRSEARGLRREARAISSLQDRYAKDGLTESEARELQNRALYLSDAVGTARKPDR